MGDFLTYPLIPIAGVVGLIAGLRRMLVIVAAALLANTVLSLPGRIAPILEGLPLGLAPQTVSTASTTLVFIGLPILVAVALRRVYAAVQLPWFMDRVLGAVLGGASGAALRQWMLG
jgi:hypothetical protein